jgi:hypothetical protein
MLFLCTEGYRNILDNYSSKWIESKFREKVCYENRFFLLLLLTLALSVVGCTNQKDSNQVKNTNVISDSKPLDIEKNDGKDKYVQLKTISDKETINKVLTILDHANWENASVSMTHPPDFKINNLYDIWIGPQKNILERL